MRLGFLVFLVLLAGLLYLANRYAYGWAKRAFSLSAPARRGLVWVLSLSLIGMFASRLLSSVLPGSFVSALIAVSSTLQLAVLLSVACLLPIDGVRLAVRLVGRARILLSRKPSPSAQQAASASSVAEAAPASDAAAAPEATPAPVATRVPETSVARRAFLSQAAAGSAFLIGSSSALYGALAGRTDYSIEEVPVRLPGLSRAFDGYSIVQLSDIHIGAFVGDHQLAAAEALVKTARPDLIVLTGDLLDNDPRLAPRLGEFVRRLGPLARHGVVAISGNHDFFAGIDPVVSALTRGGARVLRNRGEVVGTREAGFALLGVDDVWAERLGGGPDLERTLESLPRLNGKIAPARDLPRVLLCHNPSYFEAAAGTIDLQLSGHTHGGQVNLLVRPADYLLPNGWVAGRYTRKGSQLYVNRGFGTVGPPARLGSRPEVTRIVLTV